MTYNLNKQHILDLKEGRIAIDNTNNINVELLRQVLIEAFPTDFSSNLVQGTEKYYFKHPHTILWTTKDIFNLPTIPLLSFIQELPKKWCIKLTDVNIELVRKYTKNRGTLQAIGYIHSEQIDTNNWAKYIQKGYTEITFEQFKEHVLKLDNNNMKEKEIIGYLAPSDLFKGRIKKNSILVKDKNGIHPEIYFPDKYYNYSSSNYEDQLPAEIVETWEKVYKSSEVTIRMGDKFDLIVRNGKVIHINEDITDFVVKLVEFYQNLPVQFGKYRCEIGEIDFKITGCQTCLTFLREWKLVYNELQKQK